MRNFSCDNVWMKISYVMGACALGLGVVTCTQSDELPGTEPGPDVSDTVDAGSEPSGDEDPDGMHDEAGGDEDTLPDGGAGDGGGGSGNYGGLITPQPEMNGTETPVPATYWPRGFDLGVVDPDLKFRAVLVLQLRNQSELTTTINDLYNPASTKFRNYLTASDFMNRYAPTTATVDSVTGWLTAQGFTVDRVAKNRLIIQYSGTVRQFNTAFATRLHEIRRTQSTWRAPAYAPTSALDVPAALIGKIKRLHMPDPAATPGKLSTDSAPISTARPPNDPEKLTPSQLAKAYGLSDLYAQGYKGGGITIGVVGATMFRFSDAQSMWQTFGITRANPTVVETMEPIITRDLETSLDIQLAGAFAPEASVIYYGGPNNSDTTLLYTFNEAVGRAEVQVISDSFAHAEATTPYTIGLSYNESAMMAAALGITVLSASGDSVQVDVPSNSPYVTAVGGTNVELNANDTWKAEQSWGLAGCGLSRVFATPTWQQDAYAKAKGQRTVADASAVVGPYWVKYLGNWTYADGTSASTPVFAATIAVINGYRKAQGKPPVGWLNPLIYKHAATRAAFRDITTMGYGGCATLTGYDLATGIGTPKANELSTAIP